MAYVVPDRHDLRVQPLGVTEEEADQFARAFDRHFHEDSAPELLRSWMAVFEPERMFGHRANGRWFSTAGSIARRLTVPGGQAVPVAAVTVVTVSPVFRRTGLMRELMHRQLHELHQAGQESLAYLWASESAIYGRFGYGLASLRQTITGNTHELEYRPGVDLGDGFVDEVDRDTFLSEIPGRYAELVAGRPGYLERDEAWWNKITLDLPEHRRAAGALRFALHVHPESGVNGYSLFHVRDDTHSPLPQGTVRVRELAGGTPQATAKLWRFLLDLDLVSQVHSDKLALDDPLHHLVANRRALQTCELDGTYLRLVDVPASLTQRRYASEADVVIEVADPVLAANSDRFRLQAGPEGAVVTRVSRLPDVRLDVRDLASLYLGGTRATALAAAGLLQLDGADPQRTLTRLDLALRADREPFCPDDF